LGLAERWFGLAGVGAGVLLEVLSQQAVGVVPQADSRARAVAFRTVGRRPEGHVIAKPLPGVRP
jgi:hypothetical protein